MVYHRSVVKKIQPARGTSSISPSKYGQLLSVHTLLLLHFRALGKICSGSSFSVVSAGLQLQIEVIPKKEEPNLASVVSSITKSPQMFVHATGLDNGFGNLVMLCLREKHFFMMATYLKLVFAAC